jgi:chromate transporter
MPRDGTGSASHQRSELRQLAGLFLRLGLTAFGGPAVHIAMLEDQVVRRRQWLTRAEFLDLLGATNLIPGPNSTELAAHIGLRRAGWLGLLVAGGGFIGPAFLITLAFAWAYVQFGTLPQLGGVLYAVKPVVLAVVVQALWNLARTAVKTRTLAVLGSTALLLNLLGVHELLLLAASGAAMAIWHTARHARPPRRPPWAAMLLPLGPLGVITAPAAVTTTAFGLGPLFLFFLKVGAVLYGSGYVLLAFLHADLVERWRWMTEAQLLDAIAVGQVTPGPLFTTATFIGYVLAGGPGAVVATVGMFLPAFFFVAISAPWVPRLRGSPLAGAILDGVNVASLALMAAVSLQLVRAAFTDWLTILIGVGSVLMLIGFRVNVVWLVAVAAVLGWFVH